MQKIYREINFFCKKNLKFIFVNFPNSRLRNIHESQTIFLNFLSFSAIRFKLKKGDPGGRGGEKSSGLVPKLRRRHRDRGGKIHGVTSP
jgi:hypothetical protein